MSEGTTGVVAGHGLAASSDSGRGHPALSPEQKRVLALRFAYPDMSHKELSRLSGIPRTTIIRWLTSPELTQAYVSAQAGIDDVVKHRTQEIRQQAFERLTQILNDDTAKTQDRIAAGKAILTHTQGIHDEYKDMSWSEMIQKLGQASEIEITQTQVRISQDRHDDDVASSVVPIDASGWIEVR